MQGFNDKNRIYLIFCQTSTGQCRGCIGGISGEYQVNVESISGDHAHLTASNYIKSSNFFTKNLHISKKSSNFALDIYK